MSIPVKIVDLSKVKIEAPGIVEKMIEMSEQGTTFFTPNGFHQLTNDSPCMIYHDEHLTNRVLYTFLKKWLVSADDEMILYTL